MIQVRDIDNAIISSFEYIYFEFIFYNILKSRFVVNKMRRQIHIVNNLKINMLINSNIFESKKMMLDFVIEFLIINSYRDIMTFLKVISLCEKIHKIVRAYDATIVSSHLSIMMSIHLRDKCKIELFKDRNFMFILMKLFNRLELNEDVFDYIIDANMCAIQINNITNKYIIIAKNSRLSTIQEYKEEKCYIVSPYYDHLVVKFDFKL